MALDSRILVQQLSEGNESAFRELFLRYSAKVYRFGLKLTHSETLAEEILQDVFMKIWIHRSELSTVDYFPSYLYTVTRNHTFNVLKRLAREQLAKSTLEKQLSEINNETEEGIYQRDHQHLLDEVVQQLPPQQQLVYRLCHREGLKYEEVAERLHISRLTVKTHMQQALRTIKSNLTKVAMAMVIFILEIF